MRRNIMKKNEVKVGQTYLAKVSDRIVQVRIDSTHSRQGWNCTNTATGKRIHIKSAQRLRGPAKADKKKLAGTAKADQENARLRDERAKASDGMNASERAMADSAKKTPITKADATEAVKAVVTNDPKAAEIAKTVDAVKSGNLAKGITIPAPQKPAAKKDVKPKRVSAVDAAAEVLKKAGKPMDSKSLVRAMSEQGLWKSPAGRTPHATLYAAMLREISAKGDKARFKKTGRGQFAFNAEAK
jgi:hypothetical protein